MSLAASIEAWRAGARLLGDGEERLAVWSEGTGATGAPPLLLIHDYPTSSWDWRKIWTPLAVRRRLIAVDLLGCGLSAKPRRADYDAAAQADRVERVCAALDVTTLDILGAGQGGRIVQELLARQGENRAAARIRSAVLINAATAPGAPAPPARDRLLAGPLAPILRLSPGPRRFARSYARSFVHGARPEPREVQDVWTLLVEGDGHRLAALADGRRGERRRHQNRWAAALAAGLAPTRIILGACDRTAGAGLARAIRRVRADADLVLLEEAGRWPQLEAPEAVVEAVESFLAGAARPRLR